MEDALESLRRRYTALLLNAIDEAFDAGCKFERQKTSAAVSEMQGVFDKLKQAGPPADHRPSAARQARSSRYPAGRARPGQVTDNVERILRKNVNPATPLQIVKMAKAEGLDLNPSSVRMALRTLREKGLAEQVGHGEWVAR
jgi:hypothetical protein